MIDGAKSCTLFCIHSRVASCMSWLANVCTLSQQDSVHILNLLRFRSIDITVVVSTCSAHVKQGHVTNYKILFEYFSEQNSDATLASAIFA